MNHFDLEVFAAHRIADRRREADHNRLVREAKAYATGREPRADADMNVAAWAISRGDRGKRAEAPVRRWGILRRPQPASR